MFDATLTKVVRPAGQGVELVRQRMGLLQPDARHHDRADGRPLTDVMNPFTAHPSAVGETYLEHLRFAFAFGVRMARRRAGGDGARRAAVRLHDDGEPNARRAQCAAQSRRARRSQSRAVSPDGGVIRRSHLATSPRFATASAKSCASVAGSPSSSTRETHMMAIQPLGDAMRFKRLAEVDVRGKRVFIRADLNVPQDDSGAHHRRHAHPRLGARRSAMRSPRGAAVMVTSHLGRPTEGAVQRRRFAGAGREAPAASCSAATCRWSATGSTAARGTPRCARRARAARELPLQQGREEGRRRAGAQDGGALRRLRQRRLRHRAPRRGNDARHRAVRAGRLRRARCSRPSSTRSGSALAHPARPLVAIVAGSKVSTKLTMLKTLAAKVDTLIVGGGIANTFILAAGGTIGKSLAEPDLVGEAKAILDRVPGQGADPDRRRRRAASSRRRRRRDAQGRRRTSPPTT